MYTHMLVVTLLIPSCMSDHYFRFSYECAHMFKWTHYLEHVVCQMNIPDLMMNVQTCITDDTTNPCCMSDHYVWFNNECKNIFYW